MRKLGIAFFALLLTLGSGMSPAVASSCYCTVCGDPNPDTGVVKCVTFPIQCGSTCPPGGG